MESLENMLEELNTAGPSPGTAAEGGRAEKPPKRHGGKVQPHPASGPAVVKKQKRKRLAIFAAAVLAILFAAGIGFGIWWFTRPRMDATTQYWFDKFAEDGTLAGKTREQMQGILDQVVEEGMVNVSMNAVVVFEDGSSEGSLGIENIAANHYYVRVVLTNDADGSVLYESQGLKPGQYIDKITLQQDLPAGEYQCTATEIITDPDTLEDIGQIQVAVKLIVKN